MKKYLLHKTKLPAFKQYLHNQGIPHVQGKGSFQVLQVMTYKGYQCVFEPIDSPEHYSINGALIGIVKSFIASDKPKLTTGEMELLKCLQDVIDDLELRATVHKTLTGDEQVVPMSDGRYQAAITMIDKYNCIMLSGAK